MSGNYNTLLFDLMVKFSLLVRAYGILNSAFRFSIIRPSRFGLMDPPQIFQTIQNPDSIVLI